LVAFWDPVPTSIMSFVFNIAFGEPRAINKK
jgi:hypothetical protein